jgi:hypothetical protein
VDDLTFTRLQRDVEDLAVRLRNIENLDTRAMRQLLADVQGLGSRVERIDQQGSVSAEKDIASLRRTMERHEDELARKADAEIVKEQAVILKAKADAALVQEMRDDTKSNRRIVTAAVIGTAFSIGAWIIQWLITRGPG